MYFSPKFHTYLQIYSKTKAARNESRNTESDDIELCSSTQLLVPPQNGFVDYVDKTSIANVLLPWFLHPGVDSAFQRVGVDWVGKISLNEEARNQVFRLFTSMLAMGQEQLLSDKSNFYAGFYAGYGTRIRLTTSILAMGQNISIYHCLRLYKVRSI